jgi:long-subunit acyl-CoA synthetase (AMP-forming)
MALVHGATNTVCPDMRELPKYLASVHPDVLFAVPRLWEKFQVAIEAMAEGSEDAKRCIVVGLERARSMDAGSDVDPDTAAKLVSEHQEKLQAIAPILERIGLDRLKVAFVGGAPCSPEVVRFFRAVDVPLLEAYGSTECSLNIFNRIEEFKTATAGRALPDVELDVAEDGELLVRGPLNFVSYRNDPEKTAETIDADGWVHTGDIVEIDDEGYVKIVDRKKEIIISSAGKNMSPANIEGAIKGESTLIGQVVTIGDGRKFNSALLTLDAEAAPVYAKRLGLDGASLEELAEAPAIRAEIDRAIEAGNARLARPEHVRKYTLLGEAWAPDSDELTPTLKLKRREINKKYNEQIEAMYAE